ncbi:MAG: D-sedoheptulose-7-phosphate isomerase [Rhodanobacteraceae bacterium]
MNVERVFTEHTAVMQEAADTLPPSLAEAILALQACLDGWHKILACGNGGSAAAAQHLVAELVVRFRDDRRALAAVALSADTMTLTAIGNDYGYERVFARQIEAIAAPGDVLVAISTSGNSANVVAAARAMRTIGGKVIALTGGDGGELASHADVVVRAPSRVVARIQEVHDVCIHAVAEALEENARRASRP